MMEWMLAEIQEKEEVLQKIRTTGYLDLVNEAGMRLAQIIKQGNKVLLAGNGGSAADADRKSTRLNSSHQPQSRMPSSA